MKKLFLIFTTLIFIILINASFAYGFTDINDAVCQEAVNVLSSYNIISGYTDNTFKPYKHVTRAEMAKMLTITAGYLEYTENMTSGYEVS